MKKYLAFLFLTLLLISLFYIKNINMIVISVLQVFFYGVLPSLGPILLLSHIFINCEGPSYLLKLCKRCKLSPVKSYTAIMIFLGLIAGTSSLALYVNHGLASHQLSQKSAKRILTSFSTPPIPFLIALIIYNVSDSVTRWWIFGVVLVTNLLVYLLFSRTDEESDHTKKFNSANTHINKIFEKSIIQTAKSLLIILGTTILFSLLLILFNKMFTNTTAVALLGFFEYSYSLSLLLTTNESINILLIVAIVSFGSIATFLHIKWLCPSIDFFSLVKTRSLITLFNVLLTYIVLLI